MQRHRIGQQAEYRAVGRDPVAPAGEQTPHSEGQRERSAGTDRSGAATPTSSGHPVRRTATTVIDQPPEPTVVIDLASTTAPAFTYPLHTAPEIAYQRPTDPAREGVQQTPVTGGQPGMLPGTVDWYDWGVRAGVAFIFFVNALAAFITPDAFRSVLEQNLVASLLPAAVFGPMVVFAGINDVLLGAALLSGRQRRLVWAWTALWLALVGGIKLLNLLA